MLAFKASISECPGVGLTNVKFSNLKSVKGQDFEHGEELTTMGSPTPLANRCSRLIWRSYDVKS